MTQHSLTLGSVLLLVLAGCASQPTRTADEDGAAGLPKPRLFDLKAAPGANSETSARPSGEPPAPTDARASAEYHFAMAQAYAAEGTPDRAIEEYKLTLMFDPRSSLVYARLASEYVKKGMFTAAMETCKEALQRDPKFTDARLMLAGLYSTTRETEAALREYDKVLKFDPTNEEAAVYKAQVLIEDDRPEVASKELRAFLKKNRESALAYYYLGRSEQRQNLFDEAVSAYRNALSVRSGFTQAALALGYLYEEKTQTAKAMSVYQELYDSTQDPAAANRLATLYLKSEKYKDAVPYLEAIAAADPEDLNVRVKLGLVQMELKQYPKAVETFKTILSKNPDADRIHYYLGSVYEEMLRFDDAVVELKQIKADSKLYQDAALHVAYLLKQGDKLDDAKAHIQEAIAKAPKIPAFYMFQASLEEESKNLPGAVTILEGAVKNFGDDEKLRYYLASLYDRQGETDKSLAQMETILRLNPTNVDALNYIGYTWTQRGVRLNDAEKLLRKALGLRPDNGYIQDSWGWYLFVRGRVNEAVVELEKAVRLKPNESTILEHLADAYRKSNLHEKALSKYREAVRFADDTEAKRKIQLKLDHVHEELVQMGRLIPGDGVTRSPAGSASPSVAPSPEVH